VRPYRSRSGNGAPATAGRGMRLFMIPLTLDEVVAMAQYMLRSVRTGRPFWRTFFQGGPEPNGTIDENDPGFSATLRAQATPAFRGASLPWTLVVGCAVGAWLMFSWLVFAPISAIEKCAHLSGGVIVTVA